MIEKIGILTPSAKKAMYGIMTAGALTLGAGKMAAGNSTLPIQSQYPTEQVAEGSKANAVNTPVYSYERNRKLDNTCLLFAENDEEKEIINDFTRQQYLENGTFGGSILIQQTINYNALDNFMKRRCTEDDMINGIVAERFGFENVPKKIKLADETLKNWIENEYYPMFNRVLTALATTNGKPGSAQKYSDALDNIAKVNLKSVLTDEDIKRYETESGKFRAKQKDKYSVQGWSDYVAYKTYLIETMTFERMYDKLDTLRPSDNNDGHDEKYYYRAIMELYKPEP